MTEDSKDLFLVLSERELENETHNERNSANENSNSERTAYDRTYLFLPLFKQIKSGEIVFIGFVSEEEFFLNGVLLKWHFVQEIISKSSLKSGFF